MRNLYENLKLESEEEVYLLQRLLTMTEKAKLIGTAPALYLFPLCWQKTKGERICSCFNYLQCNVI